MLFVGGFLVRLCVCSLCGRMIGAWLGEQNIGHPENLTRKTMLFFSFDYLCNCIECIVVAAWFKTHLVPLWLLVLFFFFFFALVCCHS